MSAERLALLFDGIQTAVVVLSFFGLVWQLRQINRTMQHDAYSRIIEDYSRIAERLLDNPQFGRQFYAENQDFAQLPEEEKAFYNYLGLSLVFFERVYLLHRRRGIDQGIWASWERWLQEAWIRTALFPTFWKNERRYFTAAFAGFVDETLRREAGRCDATVEDNRS